MWISNNDIFVRNHLYYDEIQFNANLSINSNLYDGIQFNANLFNSNLYDEIQFNARSWMSACWPASFFNLSIITLLNLQDHVYHKPRNFQTESLETVSCKCVCYLMLQHHSQYIFFCGFPPLS